MSIVIEESGMKFGPFHEDYCFYIEKSNIYLKIQNGLQIAEFLLVRPEKNKLFIVEAKSSSPNPVNKESQDKFDNFITEISEKLLNAFTLGLSLCLKRHTHYKDEIPKYLTEIEHSSIQVVLLLVINGHKEEWLSPLNEALQKRLKCASKIWPFQVVVINEKIAQNYGLIDNIA